MAKRHKRGKKIRVELRKNQQSRARHNDLTRAFDPEEFDEDNIQASERLTGKGTLTRKRTIVSDAMEDLGCESEDPAALISVDQTACVRGRVLQAVGLHSTVDAQGQTYLCATSRLLKSLNTDQRQAVVTGDRVLVRPVQQSEDPSETCEGMIERVEPRKGLLSRTSRGRQHIIVANVDQLFIVASAAEPPLKPNLIDRFLISAEQGGIAPVIVINKVDLVDPADLQPLVGVYAQMGYRVLLVSTVTGRGVQRLRKLCVGRETVVSGQSGVGKSSLLNVIETDLELRVGQISTETNKGRHTTTAARLIPLSAGGYLVDTPGIRQFELWDVVPEEVAGFFRDLRPFINLCRFPNCTHTHEADCGVKDAVADNFLDARRYESYLHLFEGDTL